MDHTERNEKIERYGHGFDTLMETLNAIPREFWQFKPTPSEWSIHEIIMHLADSETNSAMRARKLIVEPGGTIMAYDQDAWATQLDYHSQDADDALEVLRLARKTTYALLKKQPDSVFNNAIHHPEYAEPYTFEKWLTLYSAHIPGHIEQIKNNETLRQQRAA